MSQSEFTPIERRVLAYLEQHGPTHRTKVVSDLASPDSRIGQGHMNGSNSCMPLIMGRWSKRLISLELVVHRTDRGGYYREHAITERGRAALRNSS